MEEGAMEVLCMWLSVDKLIRAVFSCIKRYKKV
jgi:hypothetical protein